MNQYAEADQPHPEELPEARVQADVVTSSELRYLRLPAELRRSAIYAMVSLPVLAAFPIWLTRLVPGHGPPKLPTPYYGVLVLVAVAMALPLRWAVRIDGRGVARRLLMSWDLWEWEVFTSGRIHKRYPFTFVDPERPWWRRTLRLGSLGKNDIKRVMELINAHYQLPPSPRLSAALKVRGSGFGREARLDSSGIEFCAGPRPQRYFWDEARRVHITRMDPLRRDFWRLAILLPDREIKLQMLSNYGIVSSSWRGATPEEINNLLHQYVPDARIDVDIWEERPAAREDVEKALAEQRVLQKALRIIACVFSLTCVGFVTWEVASGRFEPAAFVLAAATVFYWPLFYFHIQETRKRIAAIEKQITEFDEAADDG